MTGDVVYNAVLNALRIDLRGNALTVDEFNTLTPIINKRVLAHYTKDFEENIENTESLGFLKVPRYTFALSSGVGVFPTNYHRMISDPYYTDSGGVRRNIDVLSSMEYSYRESPYSLTKATVNYPTCVIGGQDSTGKLQLRVYPTTIASVFISYLREPNTPFLDYYITKSTLTTTFLTAGQNYTVTTAQQYRDGSTGAKVSATVDWEWSEDDLPLIVAYFIEAMGGIMPDELMVQVGSKDKMEISND